MTVKIQVPRAWLPGLERARGLPLGPALGSLLAPLALLEYLLCAARLGTDLGLIQLSAPDGVWSHWQVWMALAVSSHLLARRLLEAGTAPHRRSNQDGEGRGGKQTYPVNNRVQEMVRQTLDPYERDLEELAGDEENVTQNEAWSATAPREESRTAFRLSPIAAEAEALRQRVRDR